MASSDGLNAKSLIRKIYSDSLIYSLPNVVSSLVSFILIPIYTSYFSPSEFGILELIVVTGTILSIIIGLEIHQAVARHFPDAKSKEEKKNIVSTAIWTILILYLVFLLFTLPFSESLSQFFSNSGEYGSLIFFALISFGFNFIYQFSSSQLKWQMKSVQNVLVSLIYMLTSVSLIISLLKFTNLGLISVFIAQSIAATVGIGLSYLFSREYYGFAFSKSKIVELVKFSSPIVFSTLVVYAMLYVDRLFITYFLSLDDVGIYSLAFRFASIISLISAGFQTALTPIIYNYYHNSETPHVIAKLFKLFISVAAIILLLLILFSNPLVHFFANESFIKSSDLIPWLAITIIFSGIINFAPGIFIAKKTKYILYINLSSFLLNIVLNSLLIGFLGLVGVAIASAISSLVYFLLYLNIGQKYYFIPYFWIRNKAN